MKKGHKSAIFLSGVLVGIVGTMCTLMTVCSADESDWMGWDSQITLSLKDATITEMIEAIQKEIPENDRWFGPITFLDTPESEAVSSVKLDRVSLRDALGFIACVNGYEVLFPYSDIQIENGIEAWNGVLFISTNQLKKITTEPVN